MQPQINAIKQLLETNNAIASVVESILIEVIGDRASWENASLIQELRDVVNWGDIEYKDVSIPVLQQLWRSRIDLNDARINAEEADLEKFLSEAFLEDTTEDLINEKAHNENLIKELQLAVNNDNKSQAIQSLQTQIKGYQALCEGYLETQQERDREIENLKLALDAAKKPTDDLQMECDQLRRDLRERDRQIQELQISVKNHREQFDNLKSHFEVTLKAIAMNLNGIKGARKPDHIEVVDGVQISYRRYDDNLNHAQKTLIIENQQRAIAEEAKKLKGINLKDFSFDDIPL